MADLKGEGEFGIVAAYLLTVSGVKFTCLVLLERSNLGVVGIDGRAFSRLGLLGFLAKEGIDDGAAEGFLLELGYLRIDLTRSSFPGLRKKLLDCDLRMLPTLFIVADFARPRVVPSKLGLDGDFERVGI